MALACTPADASAPDPIATARQLAARHAGQPGALLPLLHAVQEALGHIPAETVAVIAEALSLSRAEVHGVLTFYPHFRGEPGGRHTLQICRAEACQAMGGEAIAAHARSRLGCDFHGTSADGAFSLEPAYCLGLCAQSPALMLDGQPHARMTAARLDRLLEKGRQA
ncbi:formate dehydrogenase subunit gamma [Bordetella pseudohinzii]|uniref:Formate dehydrogenase subunit gamma n=1 Tax=Bordetella pseudohinzii TaxID=1331258 RepID=A0A0J6C1U1_9BORD|nr:formate dehydrogenase subunit gamma [Bordetella pseudohinzii]ANY17099.1 formate dehydrogenase subunit gamma [Bordetella pseudohinzii]KMM25018.1 formate dehydrogenase [Bordetella pseudohinzii]KXA75618.1 formate dehydrogenase [Bordetella pseudohinzii]KXA77068.1 formate dehydrogenase [Bordetella pseudohinzii]CUI99896.1 NADH-quinone oxidoreductase subunit E [Bordetella pseudohinzii]